MLLKISPIPPSIDMADQQAQVTLTSLNDPCMVPAKRVLSLTPSKPKISIGRASKSASKGLVAAADNAWFDNPVMSRNHAEILLLTDNNTVQLRDVGSMHGTVVNDHDLPEQEPRSLNNGDVVKFGAEVRRGSETFPACSFKIEYRLSPYQAAETGKTYEYPESSDWGNCSEEEYTSEISCSSPYESVVDNTFSESPASKRSDSVEIVGSSSAPKSFAKDQAEQDMLRTIQMYQPVLGNSSNPLVVDSDDSQDIDDEIEVEEIDAAEFNAVDKVSVTMEEVDALIEESCALMESEIEADLKAISSDSSDSPSDSEDSVQHPSPSVSEAEEMSDVGLEEVRRLSDNRGIKISNLRSTRPIALWDFDDDDDSESENEAVEVAIAGCRSNNPITYQLANFISGEYPEDNDSVSSVNGEVGTSQASELELEAVEESEVDTSSDDDSALNYTAVSNKAELKYEVVKKALPSNSEKEVDTRHSMSLPVPVSWNNGAYVPNPDTAAYSGREPSPSDAAMVKEDMAVTAAAGAAVGRPTVQAEESTVEPLQVHRNFPSWIGSAVTQSVDPKQGKAEFFRAREQNRLQFTNTTVASLLEGVRSQGSTPLDPLHSTGTHSFTAYNWPDISRPAQEKPQQGRLQYLPLQQRSQDPAVTLQGAMMAEEFHRQRQHQMQKPQTEAPVPPALSSMSNGDLPSLSRSNPLVALPVHNFGACRLTRSSVPISDLVEQSPPSPTLSNKRKADAISRSYPDSLSFQPSTAEQRSENSKSNRDNGGTVSERDLSMRSPPAPSVAIEKPIERPAKRMRRIVEAVGYAALGGAAVGAGLFSVLVATAPDFL